MEWKMIHVGFGHKTVEEVVMAGKKEYEERYDKVATEIRVHSSWLEDEVEIDGMKVKPGLTAYPSVVKVR